MGGGCCVSNHPILDFLSDLFCSDSCCVGHASGPSESELHAKKVANELAEMKERSNESSSKTEKNIMNLKATVNKLKKQYLNKHHVYIFGHSLDVTDKDILRDLILNDNVHTTIFYHDKDTMGQQIANLVKVIGQKELIRRAGGKDKLIEFKPQKPMNPIDN